MEKSSFKIKYRIAIPNKRQGITFMKNGKVVLSQSYGRNNSSKILVYNKPSYSNKNGVGYAKLGNPASTLDAPPTSQNIFIGNDNLLYIYYFNLHQIFIEMEEIVKAKQIHLLTAFVQ